MNMDMNMNGMEWECGGSIPLYMYVCMYIYIVTDWLQLD